TNWHCRPSELRALQGLPLELQEATRRLSAAQPLCCVPWAKKWRDLTNRSFCRLLCQVASQLGFTVKRWPVEDAPGCWALTKAAKRGELKDTSAMMLHSWHGGYEKECVPSWDFYPLLEALKRRSLVVYPSPELDLLHSAKRRKPWSSGGLRRSREILVDEIAEIPGPMYRSKFMAPTEFLTMQRHGHTWKANGKDLAVATRKALKDLHSAALAVGLGTENVMLKQGFSWGGAQVTRLRPSEVTYRVLQYLSTVVLPKLPAQAVELTVLLQAKVDLVAELRWMVLNGELRGCGWVTLPVPRLGRKANSGCYKLLGPDRGLGKRTHVTNSVLHCAALEKLKLDRLKLEESIRPKVEAVVQEAVYDAGVMPQYLRVDFLVDKQGRAWLGERESWGADLVRNQENPQGRHLVDFTGFHLEIFLVICGKKVPTPAARNWHVPCCMRHGAVHDE
ncbi:unnamed protein product, partial [Cladocopium goreaui]